MSPEIRQRIDLVSSLTRREIEMRYAGSVLGAFWSFINPLMLLAIYSLIFGVVFQARWGGIADGLTLDFSLMLFVGLIMFIFFSECVTRAPLLITTQPNMVKKVVFPLNILPIVVVLTASAHALVSLLAWCAIHIYVHHGLNITSVAIPLIFGPLMIGTLGIVYVMSSLGVYLRDISQFVALVTQSLLFLSPVFYSVEQVPNLMQIVLSYNPLTYLMQEARNVLMLGDWPDWLRLIKYYIGSICLAGLGYFWFERTREGFSDVL